MWFVWLLIVVAAATVAIEVSFVYVMTVRRLRAEVWTPWELTAIGYALVPLGAAGDIVMNLTRGSWMFRERPRELMFSSRVQRHATGPDGWRKDKALRWAVLLNATDPGHIKL